MAVPYTNTPIHYAGPVHRERNWTPKEEAASAKRIVWLSWNFEQTCYATWTQNAGEEWKPEIYDNGVVAAHIPPDGAYFEAVCFMRYWMPAGTQIRVEL
jgi:hypothetical protein